MSGLPRGEHGYRRIRSVLQAGDFKPGELLREIELAESVGVTRDASGGNMVAELDYSMVTELYFMREVLEGTAVRLTAQHASDVEISILEDLCRQYEAAGQTGDGAALATSNRHFHDTLYRCSHNRYLINMLTVLHDALSLLGTTTLHSRERAADTLQEHVAVVSAVRARDPEAAEAALRTHIRNAQKVRMQQLFTR